MRDEAGQWESHSGMVQCAVTAFFLLLQQTLTGIGKEHIVAIKGSSR